MPEDEVDYIVQSISWRALDRSTAHDLYGESREIVWNGQPEVPSGRRIDHQLEDRGLFKRQLGGVRPAQNSVHERGCTSIERNLAGSVRNQTPRVSPFTGRVHTRQPVTGDDVQ